MIARIFNRLCLLVPGLSKQQIALVGTSVKVRRGTIRIKPDYDSAWVAGYLKRSETFFDIGSNFGEFSLLALVLGVQRVVAVDAEETACKISSSNLAMNFDTTRFKVIRGFAGALNQGETPLFAIGGGAASSMYQGHAITASQRGSVQAVQNWTLDELARSQDCAPDFVKIDVEGAEASVLEGSREIASQAKTAFMVEMHSNPELTMVQNADAVLSWCDELDYSAYYLKTHSPTHDSDDIGHRGRCHLLLLPSAVPYPSWLRSLSQGDPYEKALVE